MIDNLRRWYRRHVPDRTRSRVGSGKMVNGQMTGQWMSGIGQWFRADGPLPTMLSIEPTNRCNLNCPFCLAGLQNTLASTSHSEMPRPLGRMDFGLYEKIIGDAVDFGIQTLQLHFQGEPLLHPRLDDMVRCARSRQLLVDVFTNGMLMNEAQARALITAGVNGIRFSVDGASPLTYSLNRVGGDFETVIENMRRAIGLIREMDAPVEVIWQFIVLRNNEHELATARAMAGELGARFVAKTLAVATPELVPEDANYRRRMNIKPCRDIYRATFVYWNGDVVVCCYDQNGENVIGNLSGQTLTEIWNSPVARRLRLRIDRAFRHADEEPLMCRSCLKWSHHPWSTSDGLTSWPPGHGTDGAEA